MAELCRMRWEEAFERERTRYDDGVRRLDPGQLVRLGNAAYGAGLALLMVGRGDEAGEWFDLAAVRYRESWEYAGPAAWGRPLGALKAALIAGRDDGAVDAAHWTLELGAATADSAIGRYAGTLALLVLGRDDEAAQLAKSLRGRDGFPPAVAGALAALAAGRSVEYAAAAEAVLVSFETRTEHLENVPVADTVLALQALAAARGLMPALRRSAVLPGYGS